MESSVVSKVLDNDLEAELWAGGRWESKPDDLKNIPFYVGGVKHVMKFPANSILTHELLLKKVRSELGLSMEEDFRLTYIRPTRIAILGSNEEAELDMVPLDILGDSSFQFFMKVMDTIPKPLALYHSLC